MKRGNRFVRGPGLVGLVLGIIVLNIAPVALPPVAAYAQTAALIGVEGNRRVEASTIRSYFKPGPSGRLDELAIDAGYKALIATGLFQDVRISQAGGRLTVTVTENPVINRIAFEGNSRIKEEQFKAEIQSKERGTLSRPSVQADVQRMAEVYRRTGRFDITIEPKIIELPNNRVDLVFEIDEGGKTGIRTIEFIGNRIYSDYRLADVIKTSKTSFLSFLQNTNIYDPDRLEADRDLLRRFYLKHGYIDVRVVAATAQYDPTNKGFIVRFTIEEGEQYRFGTVDVVSNIRRLDPATVRYRLRMGAGDVYNAEALERSVEDITIEAARMGFAFATVRPRADRNNQARTVNLVLTIDEGQRVYIDQINIRGNSRTRDHVIRREFDVAEGDPYNRALINRAERRLKNLNYFKEVKVTAEPGSASDRVVINATVEEMSTGEFSVAGGYSTSDGFMGEVSVGERNLLGLGLYAKTAVQVGQHASGAQISFVEPYLLGYRLALGVDLFTKTQRATSFVSYDTKTTGAGLRLGWSFAPVRPIPTTRDDFAYFAGARPAVRVDAEHGIDVDRDRPEPAQFRLYAEIAAGYPLGTQKTVSPATGESAYRGAGSKQSEATFCDQCHIFSKVNNPTVAFEGRKAGSLRATHPSWGCHPPEGAHEFREGGWAEGPGRPASYTRPALRRYGSARRLPLRYSRASHRPE